MYTVGTMVSIIYNDCRNNNCRYNNNPIDYRVTNDNTLDYRVTIDNTLDYRVTNANTLDFRVAINNTIDSRETISSSCYITSYRKGNCANNHTSNCHAEAISIYQTNNLVRKNIHSDIDHNIINW